jgi:CBS domain-containing protein
VSEETPQTLVAFLRGHPPFNEMDDEALAFLADRSRVARHPKGTVLASPQDGVARRLHTLVRGMVIGTLADEQGGDRLEFGPGEAVPLAAVLGARATTSRYVAIEDVLCLETGVAAVEELAVRSAPFRRHAARVMASLVKQATERLRDLSSREVVAQFPMHRPLGDALRRPPLTCPPGTLLGDALAAMVKAKVGSIVIATPDGEPRGIFTERDLLEHTVARDMDLARPIDAVMTPRPLGLPVTALVSDAAVEMARRNIRHILVLEAGRLAGVVSERDLFALQRRSMREITQAIEDAEDLTALQAAAREIRELTGSMLVQGVGAEQLTQLIATLNDRLTSRILHLERARHDLAGLRLCWLALGSEGRHEQTFASDQDNAIVFATPKDASDEATRARVLPFAQAVNRVLDACGFPLCKGNIMAGNPQWCLSESEWREQFGDWVRKPFPEALLNATIFFDFRGLWGETALADSLQRWLLAETDDNGRFLRMMAGNALQVDPPLGFFGDFVTSGEKGEKGTIDLKTHGTRLFIDVARIYALAMGVTAQNTVARLRATGGALRIKPEEIDAKVDAFNYVMLLRLRHQREAEASGSNPNRLRPADLNDLESRVLKESLRQARSLQRKLRLDHRL